jgi:hypothetical protein
MSIAFPALGAGNLGYPRDVIAREMFSCVDEFAENYPTSSIADVRFVVYSGDSNSVKVLKNLLFFFTIFKMSNIRTLSVNIKFICTSFRNRQNSEPSANFSCLFRSEYK